MGCVSKALSIATGHTEVAIEDMLKYNHFESSWAPLLLNRGFKRVNIPAVPYKPRKTVRELADELGSSMVVVARCAGHVVAIKHNIIYDDERFKDITVYYYYAKEVK